MDQLWSAKVMRVISVQRLQVGIFPVPDAGPQASGTSVRKPPGGVGSIHSGGGADLAVGANLPSLKVMS